ncbi:hypothetical protein BGW80DRAFT_1438550 [Lactifluus volemus]|nr:hypothetical protein BGW80DRAFT_1438550 [Lactifluus volemus]
MSKLHDFLVEHAKFPFPALNDHLSSSTTDISTFEADFLEKKNPEWKAKLAVRDDTLVQKLCDTLEGILGDAPLVESGKDYLLESFSPRIQFDRRGREDEDWSTNSSEAHSRRLLDRGFFPAASKCFWEYDRSVFKTTEEHLAEGAGSKVDYVARVNDEIMGLCEAKSPSVMENACDSLPLHGIELKWVHGQPLVPRILAKAALYMGLRKTQWLFLTCFNYWIVCRLVRDDSNPYLVYSPRISIRESSEPFRAFLGVPVEPSAYNPDIVLDTIAEENDGPLLEDDIDDGSGEYQGSSGRGPMTRSRARNNRYFVFSELSEDLQVWTRLYTTSNNSLAIPPCARNDKPHLWFTRFIASGSTGAVWQCRFDTCHESFAAKIVEVLRPSDTQKRQRLRNEFKIYLILEEAYQSGRLHDRIAPRCYGAFVGRYLDVLVLELCDSIMNSWDDLSDSERSKVYKLVQDLHRIGIAHEDLEPRNIVRTHGGGFLLIDFSESRKHVYQKCYELQRLRKLLWKRQPLQAKGVNLG